MNGAREAPYDFMIYVDGPKTASVCTSLANEAAERRMNRERPAYAPWRVSASATFRDGTQNGCSCRDFPDTHRHLLFSGT